MATKYIFDSDASFAPYRDSESGQLISTPAPHEQVWQAWAQQEGIAPTVEELQDIAGESTIVTVANPAYVEWKANKKAQGLDVGMSDIPGVKYTKNFVVLKDGQPLSEPIKLKTGKGFFSSISSAIKDLSPILIPALTAGLAAPLGAAMGATAGSTAASALGGATIAGGVTALGGGGIKDVLGAAAIGGAAPYAKEALGLSGGGGGAGGGVGYSGLENELAGLAAAEAGMGGAAGAALPGIENALAGGAAGVGAYQQAASQLAAADIAARAAGAAGAAGTAGAAGAAGAGAAGAAAAGAAGSALGNLGTAALVGAAGDILGGIVQSKAAETAADAQERAAMAGIAEMRRQFDVSKQILQPYVSAGTQAIGGLQPYMQGGQQAYQQQLALAGVLGPEAQKAAIGQIESSPFFQSQVEQGERALLQRASATGGLRGGNLQAGLAQFRPQMLQQAIEQQYGRLGGLSAAGLETGGLVSRLGQASAAGQASQAGALGQGVAGLMQQQGAAQAGAALAGAAPWQALANIPGQLAGLSLATGRPITSLFG